MVACPACSSLRSAPVKGEVYSCRDCGAIFGDCYLGDSYGYVLPRMAAEDVPAERIRYFDFTTVGSAGVSRRHGWYDPATKLIVQIG